MKKVMICLIGEQPVANLLPILHCKPQETLLIYSKHTKKVSTHLKSVLESTVSKIEEKEIQETYEITKCQNEIEEILPPDTEFIFNLTGGTKPMSFAALQIAQKRKSSVIYLQSERAESLLYIYTCNEYGLIHQKIETLRELIKIKDFLQVHGIKLKENQKKGDFEKEIYAILEEHVSEIKRGVSQGNMEIDLVIRCKNQVGVVEVKTGKSKHKTAIDQLNTASQREFLGTYTKRFLIVDKELDCNNLDLAKTHNIEVIPVCSWEEKKKINDEDKKNLIATIKKVLGVKIESR